MIKNVDGRFFETAGLCLPKRNRRYRSTPQTSSKPKPIMQPGSKSSISSAGGRAPNTCPSNRSRATLLVHLTLNGVPLCCNITTLNTAIGSSGVAATGLVADVSPLLDDPNLSRLSNSGYLTMCPPQDAESLARNEWRAELERLLAGFKGAVRHEISVLTN